MAAERARPITQSHLDSYAGGAVFDLGDLCRGDALEDPRQVFDGGDLEGFFLDMTLGL
jgi:hypothetical protein